MKNGFSNAMFGYDKKQVDEFIRNQSNAYNMQQEQLDMQKERILELNTSLRDLKAQTEDLQKELLEYRNRELVIAQTMIHSAEKARLIEEEGLEHRRLLDEEVESRHAAYHQYVADKWTMISQFENSLQQMVDTFAQAR